MEYCKKDIEYITFRSKKPKGKLYNRIKIEVINRTYKKYYKLTELELEQNSQ